MITVERRLSPVGTFIAGLVIFLFMLLFSHVTNHSVVKKLTGQLKETTALVTYVEIDESTSTTRNKRKRTTTMYQPYYEYTVDGELYESKSKTSSNQKVKTGDKIKVYYEKKNPSKSHYVTTIEIIIQVVFFSLAILLMSSSLFKIALRLIALVVMR